MNALCCPYFPAGTCRSCACLDQTPEQVLDAKQAHLQGLFPGCAVAPAVACQAPIGSRIRARLAVSGQPESAVFGFFDEQQRVVPVEDCPLHHSLITGAIDGLRDFVRQARLQPYDPERNTGELKFVVLTASPSHGGLMIQWVLRSRESVDRIRRVWGQLTEDLRRVWQVMSVGIQSQRSSRIQGDIEIGISDAQRLPIRFGSVELGVGSGSFVQTNHEIASALYLAVEQKLADQPRERVLDLYCGTGAFSLLAGRCGHDVVGIDITEEAIASAVESATRQGLAARFVCQSLQTLPAGETAAGCYDTVICNPPRRGLDDAAEALIRRVQPRRLIYSSCNPETLRRDVDRWRGIFRIQFLQLFDMFPMNRHYEVLCELVRETETTVL